MYKKPTPSQGNATNIKKPQKPVDRAPSALQDRKNDTASNEFKNKDEVLLNYVKEYLQLNGFNRSYEVLKN